MSISSITIHKMSPSDRMTSATHGRLVLLLVAVVGAAAICSVAADVDSFSYPVFNSSTTKDLIAGTNTTVLTSASLQFDIDDRFVAEFNRTEGFLLLSRTVDIWRAGAGGAPALEASFNTSFVLTSATTPVAFVVLRDRYPTLNGIGGLRGFANYSDSDAADGATPRNASGSLAFVEVGPVRSYGPDEPAVGLNVTVTPNATAAGARAVWIEYDAAVHRLSVYVTGAGEARPAAAMLDASLSLAGRRTTEKALVGFFASRIQDILVGVRGWNLTVDKFDSSGGDGWKKGTSWWVILVAVLGSVAAMA